MMFGVDGANLSAALVERQISIRGEVQHMRNKVKEATEASEALAKASYSALFDDLVKRINKAVGGEQGVKIGVLDIFGFEIFEKNCSSSYASISQMSGYKHDSMSTRSSLRNRSTRRRLSRLIRSHSSITNR